MYLKSIYFHVRFLKSFPVVVLLSVFNSFMQLVSLFEFLRHDVKFGCLIYSKNDSVSLQLSVVLYNSHHEKVLLLLTRSVSEQEII